MFEMPPNTFIRIQFRSVCGKALQVNLSRPTIGEEVFDLIRTVDTSTIPNDQQFATEIPEQMTQESHTIQAGQRAYSRQGRQLSGQRDPTHHRQMIARLKHLQDWRLTARGIRSDHSSQRVESGFIYADNQPARRATSPMRIADEFIRDFTI